MFSNKKSTFVCKKHRYSRKGWGKCPICQNELESIGDRKRIGHMGQFDKIERKTRNLNGQKPVITDRQRKLQWEKIKQKRLLSVDSGTKIS